MIHSAIHAARDDANVRPPRAHRRTASPSRAQNGGLLPISQQSIFVLRRSATTTTRASRFATTRSRASCATSATRTFLMLRNHGLLTVGATVADAFLSMYMLRERVQDPGARAGGGGELDPVDPQAIVDGPRAARRR